jgi:hypothetical protein
MLDVDSPQREVLDLVPVVICANAPVKFSGREHVKPDVTTEFWAGNEVPGLLGDFVAVQRSEG